MKSVMVASVLALLLGVGLSLRHLRNDEEQKKIHCIELAAEITKTHPNTPYAQLPVFEQMQLQNACDVPIH